MRGDMTDLPFGPDSFDLIWSEGAAYIMGISEAFSAWRAFLRPGGYVVVTELVWLVDDVPAEVRDLFTSASTPASRDVAGNLERIAAAGYEIVDHFTLPAESWWTHYQSPLEARIPGLLDKYAGDEAALAVINETIEEHRIRREYPETYGYEFFIARCACPDGPEPGSSWEPGQGRVSPEPGEDAGVEPAEAGDEAEAPAFPAAARLKGEPRLLANRVVIALISLRRSACETVDRSKHRGRGRSSAQGSRGWPWKVDGGRASVDPARQPAGWRCGRVLQGAPGGVARCR